MMRWLVLVFLWMGGAIAQAEETHACRGWDVHGSQLPIGLDLEGEGFRYAPDRSVDVLHIKIDVTPDFRRRSIDASAWITFRPIAQPVSEVRLDAIDLDVQSVECERSIRDYVVTRRDITVLFDEPIPVDQTVTVQFRYRAFPERGLYFRTPEMGYPEGDTHLWTQGEAHEARFWFPCFDYPNERSSTEIICRVPPDMTVLSNGEKVGESVDPQTGLKAVHWLHNKPHVNYLVCLVAGYLKKLEDQHRDVPLGFYTQPSLFAHAANSFQDTRQIMAFFEEEIGMPFPWNKYDQVTIVDFVAGGMENTTLTTLTHRTIFSSETENIYSTRSLDAHEMAHQWFGDYVTCKDWSHLWLNEGFATYYALLYEQHKFGRDALLYGLYQNAEQNIFRMENDRKPIVYKAYRNASEQFDYRAYPKGSWVLHMLRSQTGDNLFRQAVRAYLERHALQSVVTDDLRSVFEELSGKTWDRFFDQWVYHARFPDLEIRYRWLPDEQLAHVTVRQTQTVDDDVLLFHFPTQLRFILEDGQIVDHDIQIDSAEHDFFVPLPSQPKIVRFDPHYTVLARVRFDKPDAMLLAQLDNHQDVIGRLLAVEGLRDRNTTEIVERLGRVLREDPFYGVRIAASRALRAHPRDDQAYEALVAGIEQEDARVRRQVVRDATSVYRPETLALVERIAAQEKNPAVLAGAIENLAKFHQPAAQRLITRFLRDDSFREELAQAAIEAMVGQNDPELQDPLIRMIEQRAQELSSRTLAQALRGVGRIAHHAQEQDRARRTIEAFVDDPREPVQVAALEALGTLGDARADAVLRSFTSAGNDRVAAAARSALEALNRQRPLTTQELDEMRRQLGDLLSDYESLKQQLEQVQQRLKAKE